ncbi:hypothetical protein WKI65_41725 [Streptomyces sp. MS1.AVA.3]|uniref:hypothetical protein n=1 Tax=Streptomyces decoyicus TaxID=249567 RepID=UPI0030C2A04E
MMTVVPLLPLLLLALIFSAPEGHGRPQGVAVAVLAVQLPGRHEVFHTTPLDHVRSGQSRGRPFHRCGEETISSDLGDVGLVAREEGTLSGLKVRRRDMR